MGRDRRSRTKRRSRTRSRTSDFRPRTRDFRPRTRDSRTRTRKRTRRASPRRRTWTWTAPVSTARWRGWRLSRSAARTPSTTSASSSRWRRRRRRWVFARSPTRARRGWARTRLAFAFVGGRTSPRTTTRAGRGWWWTGWFWTSSDGFPNTPAGIRSYPRNPYAPTRRDTSSSTTAAESRSCTSSIFTSGRCSRTIARACRSSRGHRRATISCSNFASTRRIFASRRRVARGERPRAPRREGQVTRGSERGARVVRVWRRGLFQSREEYRSV